MLPPGHVAAGFVTAEALLKATHANFTPVQTLQLLWWGAFFGFAPDLDSFVAFAIVKGWWYKPGTDSTIHRSLYSHIPIFWLVAGIIAFLAAPDVYWKYVAALLVLGSWSHFLLDSIDYGIMWLWPFNKEHWALRNRGIKKQIQAQGFFSYWFTLVKFYCRSWTFYCEIVIIVIALIIFVK